MIVATPGLTVDEGWSRLPIRHQSSETDNIQATLFNHDRDAE